MVSFVWFANLWKSGWYISWQLCELNSPKCVFVKVAWYFDFTNFITENKYSQQYVVLNTELNRTLVFQVLGIYFLELVASNLAFQSVSFLQEIGLWQMGGKLNSHHRLHQRWRDSQIYSGFTNASAIIFLWKAFILIWENGKMFLTMCFFEEF